MISKSRNGASFSLVSVGLQHTAPCCFLNERKDSLGHCPGLVLSKSLS